MRRMVLIALAALAASLTLPAAAWAHAALLHTTPVASRVVNTPPKEVALALQRGGRAPLRDRLGHGRLRKPRDRRRPSRSPADADTLVVPLKRLHEGWYLVYWRVISVDGHPVRGAFTFALGPKPGPGAAIRDPVDLETAATPRLVTARWVAFLSMMAAIGLFVLRIVVARPMVARVSGTRLRSVTIAFGVASVVALLAIPIYVLLATAEFALRSFWSFGALFPLVRVSAFGRGWLDLELIFALFAAAAAVAIWLDRPERRERSIAAVLALAGALGAAVSRIPSVADGRVIIGQCIRIWVIESGTGDS